MTKNNSRMIALAGGLALLLGAHPSAYAQATPDANAPAAAATPATPPATTPPDAVPATPAPVEQPTVTHKNPRFRIGPAVGIYLPSSSKTRDRFGDTWYSIGIGLGAINGISTRGTVGIDANLFYHGRDGNHAFFLPIGIGYRIALSSNTNEDPYVGVSADADFADITSHQDNVNNSFTVGAGGSAFVGINFGHTAFVEARYLALSKANGFDLSGLSLSAGYRF